MDTGNATRISELMSNILMNKIAVGKILNHIPNMLLLFEELETNENRGCYISLRKNTNESQHSNAIFLRVFCGPMSDLRHIRTTMADRNDFHAIEKIIATYTVGFMMPFSEEDGEIKMESVNNIRDVILEVVPEKLERLGLDDLLCPGANYNVDILDEE